MSNYLIEELVQKRKERKLSQKELAQLAGLTQQHISEIEGGRTDPRLSTVLTLALALGLRMSFLDENMTVLHKKEMNIEPTPQSMVDELRIED